MTFQQENIEKETSAFVRDVTVLSDLLKEKKINAKNYALNKKIENDSRRVIVTS